MPGPREFFRIPAFDGGLVINKHPTQLKPNEAARLRNVEFGKRGGLRRRFGYSAFGTGVSGSTAWEGAIPFVVKSLAGIRFLIAFYNGIAYSCQLPGTTWTQFASGFTKGRKWGGAVYGNKLYYGNGVDPIHTFNLATLVDSVLSAASGTAPRGNVFAIYKNTLIVTGDEAQPHILYASAVGEPDRWDTSADQALAQIIGALDGEENIGVVPKGNVLKVIRSNGQAFSLDYDTNGVWRLDEDGVVTPCVAKYAVVQTENDIITFGPDGVYSYGNQVSYFGGERPGEISAKISPLWDSFMPHPEYDYYLVSHSGAAGTYFKGNVLFACRTNGASQNNRVLVTAPGFNYAWSEWTGWNVGVFITDPETEELWGLSSENGTVFQATNVYADGGTAIDFDYQSGALTFDPPVRSTVRWVYCDFLADSGLSGTILITTDENTAGQSFTLSTSAAGTGTSSGPLALETAGTSPVGDSTAGTFTNLGDNVGRKAVLLKGRYVRCRVRTNQANIKFELYGLSYVQRQRTIQSYKYDHS